MKHKKSFNLLYLTCAGMLCVPFPSHAFLWPTFDIAEVTNTINGMSSQVDSVMATTKSTFSSTELQNSIGGYVGSLNKFTNKDEDNKKMLEKAEKRRRRAEWVAKRKKQIQDAQKAANDYADTGKDLYNQGQELYEESSEYVDQAKDYYDQGQSYLETAHNQSSSDGATKDMEKDLLPTEQDGFATDDTEPSLPSGKAVTPAVQKPQQENNYQVYDIDESALDNQAIADLVSDQEFSEGVWSLEDENKPVLTMSEPKQLSSEKSKSLQVEAAPNLIGEETLVKSDRQEDVKIIRREPFMRNANPLNENVELKAQDKMNTFSAGEMPQQKSGGELISEPSLAKQVVPAKTNMDIKVIPSVIRKQQPLTGVRLPALKQEKSSVQDTNVGGRKAFKTLKVSYRSNLPMAFAQEASGDFKTGTNEDGKFIYSDILADKCNMNFDNVSEEKVRECIKIFVLGMNHENAVTAATWKKQYNQALHDHAANDLSVAINQKAFAASFDTKVAEDLESKSKALTTEREEVAFAGKINQTNQEIIIRLMESLTAQAMTDALNAIEGMDADYYKEQEE